MKMYRKYTRMDFEFDLKKSQINSKKHGIDFQEAEELWVDEHGLTIKAKSEDEIRYALIARLKNKIWTAFFTYRKEKVRIISVRRARKNEEALYESKGIG